MQELRRSAREPQLAEPWAGPLRHNPGDINSDSSDAVGSRGAGPSSKGRYMAAAEGYRNGADQTVQGKKAAIAREWGLCLLEGGKFAAPGDAGVYEGVRKNVDYHIQQLGKALLLGPCPLVAPPSHATHGGRGTQRGCDFDQQRVRMCAGDMDLESTKIKQLSVAPMLAETINRLHWCGLACLRAGAQAPRTLPS